VAKPLQSALPGSPCGRHHGDHAAAVGQVLHGAPLLRTGACERGGGIGGCRHYDSFAGSQTLTPGAPSPSLPLWIGEVG